MEFGLEYSIGVGRESKDPALIQPFLRRPEESAESEKQDSLSNELIELAAGIAAFYSKAKHSNLVPVIYTKRKYIWKRKDMPPGQVFTKFTKSVIIRPFDPRNIG